jgi:hypothetical protein
MEEELKFRDIEIVELAEVCDLINVRDEENYLSD